MLRTVSRLSDKQAAHPEMVAALAKLAGTPDLTVERLQLMTGRPDCHLLFTENAAGQPAGVATLHVQRQLVGIKAWLDIVTADDAQPAGFPLMDAVMGIAKSVGVAKLDAVGPLPWGRFVYRGTGFYELDPRISNAGSLNAHVVRLNSSMITRRLLTDLDVLVAELSSSPKPPLTAAHVASVVDDPTHYVFGLFDPLSGGLIGTISLFVQYELGVVRGWIEDVVRHPTRRGGGIGTTLIRHGIAMAGQLGVEKLQLTSAPARGTARDLYAANGFELRTSSTYRYRAA